MIHPISRRWEIKSRDGSQRNLRKLTKLCAFHSRRRDWNRRGFVHDHFVARGVILAKESGQSADSYSAGSRRRNQVDADNAGLQQDEAAFGIEPVIHFDQSLGFKQLATLRGIDS